MSTLKSDELKERLINLVRERRSLWDPSERNYKDAKISERLWREISMYIGEPQQLNFQRDENAGTFDTSTQGSTHSNTDLLRAYPPCEELGLPFPMDRWDSSQNNREKDIPSIPTRMEPGPRAYPAGSEIPKREALEMLKFFLYLRLSSAGYAGRADFFERMKESYLKVWKCGFKKLTMLKLAALKDKWEASALPYLTSRYTQQDLNSDLPFIRKLGKTRLTHLSVFLLPDQKQSTGFLSRSRFPADHYGIASYSTFWELTGGRGSPSSVNYRGPRDTDLFGPA
uniref:MADF domain-containing protein n=1 Tax=Timema bartmani TaxID=61472 RepID=A0A7R9ETS6_9NEOP|nr:unnamed protein product [Timema bartmani]